MAVAKKSSKACTHTTHVINKYFAFSMYVDRRSSSSLSVGFGAAGRARRRVFAPSLPSLPSLPYVFTGRVVIVSVVSCPRPSRDDKKPNAPSIALDGGVTSRARAEGDTDGARARTHSRSSRARSDERLFASRANSRASSTEDRVFARAARGGNAGERGGD